MSKPVEIAPGIYDVGVTDWNIRDFHGYSTHRGTTYNAFLIIDEKITLIDTVKKEFVNQLIENISQIVDLSKIDYVISNHTEMDHSGSLPHIMNRVGKDKPLFCSKMGHKNLSIHFQDQWNYKELKEGEEIKLGKRTLTFIETRMLHWPDSMFSYLKEDKILFSSDAFGQHYACFEKFDDQVTDEIFIHAKKYFANILLLYAPLILKLVEKIQKLGLQFNMICPDHGILWKNPSRIISEYTKWSLQKDNQNKALIVYDTMWHSTEKMAFAIADGLQAEGIQVKPLHLRKWHRSDIMTEVLDAKAVIIGSPTLNNGLFPTVADFLTYMKGLKPKNKVGACFGSYGWSGEAVKVITKELESMEFNMPETGITQQFVPNQEGLKKCYDFGQKLGKMIK